MSSCKDEDESSLETGDLGLGLGLKPGSLPILNVLRYNDVGSKKDFPSVTDKPFVPPNQNQYSQIEKIRGKNKILKDSVNKGLGAKTEGQIPSSNMNRGRTPSVEEHKTVAGL